MAWQSSTINPTTTSPASDITKLTNDLQVLRSTFNGGTDADVPTNMLRPDGSNNVVHSAGGGLSVAMGVSADPYGTMNVTRPGTANNFSYFNMTRSGQQPWGMGIDQSNRYIIGVPSAGYAGTIATAALAIGTTGDTYFPGVSTTASAANAFLNNASTPANQLLRSTSSLRYKKDVRDLPAEKSELLWSLRPVVYKSKAEADDQTLDWYGLIAEEVAAVDPRLVHYTELDGVQVPDGVQYDRLTVLLLAEVKALRERVAALEA